MPPPISSAEFETNSELVIDKLLPLFIQIPPPLELVLFCFKIVFEIVKEELLPSPNGEK